MSWRSNFSHYSVHIRHTPFRLELVGGSRTLTRNRKELKTCDSCRLRVHPASGAVRLSVLMTMGRCADSTAFWQARWTSSTKTSRVTRANWGRRTWNRGRWDRRTAAFFSQLGWIWCVWCCICPSGVCGVLWRQELLVPSSGRDRQRELGALQSSLLPGGPWGAALCHLRQVRTPFFCLPLALFVFCKSGITSLLSCCHTLARTTSIVITISKL